MAASLCDANPHGHTYSDGYRNSYHDARRYHYSESYCDGHAYIDTGSNGYRDSISDSYGKRGSNRHFHTNGDAGPQFPSR